MLTATAPEQVFVEVIDVPERLRQMDSDRVEKIAESMQEIGLQTPIQVRSVNDGEIVLLVAGRHRLEAAGRLGWEKIAAVFVEGEDDDFRLWEIAENLHRSELTPLERSEHIAEWIRLTDGKLEPPRVEAAGASEEKPAQLGQVSKGGRGNRSGVSEASRKIGVKRQEAQRAVKIDSITPEAKKACRDAGLDKNQSKLLKVAAAPPAEQPAVVQRVVAQMAAPKEPAPASSPPASPMDEVVALLKLRLGRDFGHFQDLIREVDPVGFRHAILEAIEAKAA